MNNHHASAESPDFSRILDARLSRRSLLKGSLATAAASYVGGASLLLSPVGEVQAAARRLTLNFAAVPKGLDDAVRLPRGYSYSVLLATGDPIVADLPAYANDGSDDAATFAHRAGDHNDGMHYFGMGNRGQWDRNASARGLLCVNHEAVTPAFLHKNGPTIVDGVRVVEQEVMKEMLAHGVSVVEVVREGQQWKLQKDSRFNRRITTFTDIEISGPAARSPLLVTKYSHTGTRTRGTLANCANGHTPWGTYLTCEENWAGFFRRSASDDVKRSPKELAAFSRYGIGGKGKGLWATVRPDTADNRYGRWDAGDTYLDDGTLYVARFNADGSGDWIELQFGRHGITADHPAYAFSDQADVLIHARLAADAVGATKMDRPEWGAVNPRNGEVYMTLTYNPNRDVAQVDAANPRSYTDARAGKQGKGNVNGHIIRWAEQDGKAHATRFLWDVFLFAARESASRENVNLSALTADNDFSSPDGLWFSQSGLLWIETDDSAYTDTSNCMLLAAIPGKVGDGGRREVVSGDGDAQKRVGTHVGAPASDATLRRFLVGPVDSEITGLAESPDGRALFVNIQHPGETTTGKDFDLARPATWLSHWPGGGATRPRSATIVITRDDGGPIGAEMA